MQPYNAALVQGVLIWGYIKSLIILRFFKLTIPFTSSYIDWCAGTFDIATKFKYCLRSLLMLQLSHFTIRFTVTWIIVSYNAEISLSIYLSPLPLPFYFPFTIQTHLFKFTPIDVEGVWKKGICLQFFTPSSELLWKDSLCYDHVTILF